MALAGIIPKLMIIVLDGNPIHHPDCCFTDGDLIRQAWAAGLNVNGLQSEKHIQYHIGNTSQS
ncbi:MAG: hypothetical protein Ct9H300mP28_32240 [Pseudomonadota bacterium]|nr:MAG: hypothetical protein Ct9H300mP28_32240 [Pseudomonadota bacterium]